MQVTLYLFVLHKETEHSAVIELQVPLIGAVELKQGCPAWVLFLRLIVERTAKQLKSILLVTAGFETDSLGW